MLNNATCSNASAPYSVAEPQHIVAGDIALITFTFMHLADAFIQSDLHSVYTFFFFFIFFFSVCVPWDYVKRGAVIASGLGVEPVYTCRVSTSVNARQKLCEY